MRIYTPLITLRARERGRSGRRSPSRASCSSRRWRWLRSCRPSSSTRARRRSSPVTVAPPPGASSEAVLERAIEAEADPPRPTRRRARPDEHPGRGRHRLPDDRRRPERPAREQRHGSPSASSRHGRPRPGDEPSSPTALAPVKTDGYDVDGLRGRRLHLEQPQRHRQRARTRRGQGGERRGRRGAGRRRPTCSTSRATCRRHARDPGHASTPTRRSRVGLTAAQVAQRGPRRRSSRRRPRRSTLDDDGQPIDVVVQIDPDAVHVASRSSGSCRSAPSPRCRCGKVATVEQVDVQGIDHPHRRARRPRDHGRDRRATTRAPCARRSRPTIDALVADGQIPAASTSELAGVTPAAERGVRRPVRLDGRRHPARLRDDGADVQLARHAVHHPVQPAAGDDRRVPGAVPHRPAASASAR